MITSEKTDEIIPALIAATLAFEAITKDSSAPMDGGRTHRYASLGTILGAVTGPLLENGVLILQGFRNEEVVTRLAHSGGQWIETSLKIPTSRNAHSVGSAVTYGRRYGLQALLSLAAEDDDDGASAQLRTGKPPPPQSPVEPPSRFKPIDDALLKTPLPEGAIDRYIARTFQGRIGRQLTDEEILSVADWIERGGDMMEGA